MSSMWGDSIKISIFGESHSKAMGVTMDNLPPGIPLDFAEIAHHMKRRSPGNNEWSSQRKEDDDFDIVSGFFNGYTTGTPLTAIIYNKDKKSDDYEAIKNILRPGHADHTGHVRYAGFEDYRGGGHFSGRLTAPLVFAGSVARQILKQKGVRVAAHILRLAQVDDKPFDMTRPNDILVDHLQNKDFPVIDDEKALLMKEKIADALSDDDSVGGVIEVCAVGVSSGLGSPMFDSIESKVSSLMFAVPAVKGVEFGAGFSISDMMGSEANDEYIISQKGIATSSNNNGGVIGGITNAMPIIVRVAIKPTPSIAKEQNTINIRTGHMQKIKIEGRHDPCIVPRAVPVIESVLALALCDFYLQR